MRTEIENKWCRHVAHPSHVFWPGHGIFQSPPFRRRVLGLIQEHMVGRKAIISAQEQPGQLKYKSSQGRIYDVRDGGSEASILINGV